MFGLGGVRRLGSKSEAWFKPRGFVHQKFSLFPHQVAIGSLLVLGFSRHGWNVGLQVEGSCWKVRGHGVLVGLSCVGALIGWGVARACIVHIVRRLG